MAAFYEEKGWYKSKTIWASIATVVLGVLALFGVQADGSQINNYIDTAFIVLGVITGYGRATATTKIAPATSA